MIYFEISQSELQTKYNTINILTSASSQYEIYYALNIPWQMID